MNRKLDFVFHLLVSAVVFLSASHSNALPVETVLLEDDFNSENGGDSWELYNSFANWAVFDGTVDLVDDEAIDEFGTAPGGDGLYVDMDGGNMDAGRLESLENFTLDPGLYRLMVEFAGPHRDATDEPPNQVTVSLADVYTEDFTFDTFEPFTLVQRDILVTTATNGTLGFTHSGGDNEGLLLDNVRLSLIPEPSTCLLLGALLLSSLIARRPRR